MTFALLDEESLVNHRIELLTHSRHFHYFKPSQDSLQPLEKEFETLVVDFHFF